MNRFMATFVLVLALVVSAPALGQSPDCSDLRSLVTCEFESGSRLPIRWEKSPVVLRWAIVTKPTDFESGVSGSECKQVAPLDEALHRDNVSKEDFIQKTTRHLEVWSDAGIKFQHTDSEEEADIWLGTQELPPWRVAAMNLRVERRESGAHAITKAALCINPLSSVVNFDRPIVHEFGHAIGLGHDFPKDAVMNRRLEGVTRLSMAEIALVFSHYSLKLALKD